ncbi:hypothetical protein CISIN_1g040058mg [Citrus sinensis]|uniref:protein-serine/threonine phosphatase n=1 Tax=Citrus sinensis TaxID=2711 RepID=A0A067DAB1_CITSI|nr:hypothetical protein CISIN_1g040058mg [Citrus sinensis]
MGAYSCKECVGKTKFVIKRKCEQSLSCAHTTVRDSRCIFCSQAMNDSFGLSFDYMLRGLRYSEQEERKLQLVLNLDHTLLHCRNIKSLSSGEKYLKKQIHSFIGSLFQMANDKLVKLRPFVRTFLEQASSLVDIYLCTMSTRCYAEAAVKLLDLDSKYFSSRIIAREDFNGKDRKNPDLVRGQERGIVILDDTESVWSDHTENLIVLGKYVYFRDKELNGDHKSYSETLTDESENEEALANVLRVLKTIHRLFFDSVCGDVRTYLPKVRSEFSRDVLYFSAIFRDCLWAEQEEKFLVQEKKFLVHPRWIDAYYFLWRRRPEDDYLP